VSKIISAGSDEAGMAWAGFGVTYALNSDMTLNAVMAVSMTAMDRKRCVPPSHRSNPYIQRALMLCNQAMASETTYPHPEELLLTAGLIFAFGLLFPGFLPLVANPGELDILLLARANLIIYERYIDQLKNSFVEKLLNPVPKGEWAYGTCEVEFITFLRDNLVLAKQAGEVDEDEERICQITLDRMQLLCYRALVLANSYPLLCILNTLHPDFADACRSKKSFSVCVFAYIAACLRISIFVSDHMIAWENQIMSSYAHVPVTMYFIIDRAKDFSHGKDFLEDYKWLSKLRANL
jgi:hypothetical protein